MSNIPIFNLARFARLFAVCLVLAAGASAGALQAAGGAQSSYASADEAVSALVAAVRSPGSDALVSVFGPEGADIADSGDPVADAARRQRFITAFEEAHKIEQEDAARSVLAIGKDEYPFPIPLVQVAGKWHWDTAAGIEAMLTRRIGENELSAIQVVRAFVDAQKEYAESERDGAGIQYARRLMSREGRKDGLYWPTPNDEAPSPIGPLVAKAQQEGYRRTGSDAGPPHYHGYVYRMLYAQGRNAEGGAHAYIVNDRMIGGFGLIATPANYGNSGVMTFIVNQDGVVFERDLGPDSLEVAGRIKAFDPDQNWKKVSAE